MFIGAITVTFNGAHLRMDLMLQRMPAPLRRAINGLIAAAFIVCGIFVIPQSWQIVSFLHDANQVSNTAGVPKEIPQSAILVGFVFMVLAVLFRLRAYVGGRY